MAKRVTIKDIAKECGVSITTVSRVLNSDEKCCTPETEKKIMDAVEKFNYHPNPAARSLVTKKTNLIGVVLPDIYNNYFQDFFKGAENYLDKYGYRLILCNTDSKITKERKYVDSLSQGLVDGILITTMNNDESDKYLLKLFKAGFPMVAVERYGKELEEVPKILFDNQKAVRIAVEKLYELGHRRIAFIRGPHKAANANLRYQGYLQGLEALNIPFDEGLVCEGDYKMDSGYEGISRLLKEKEFTAIVASNDLMAVGACKAVRGAGKKVPDDISVIGHDGTMLAELHQPSLDTVQVRGYEMGQMSARILLRQIQGKPIEEKTVIFEPVLTEARSIKQVNE